MTLAALAETVERVRTSGKPAVLRSGDVFVVVHRAPAKESRPKRRRRIRKA